MSRISDDQRRQLEDAIRLHEFPRRIIRLIEHQHRVVFHAQTAGLDARFIRASAEEILMADLLTRFAGDIDKLYLSLREAESRGKSWAKAIGDYAAYAHNYFTTPLGVVLRRDLFGENCHFVTPAAGRYFGTAPLTGSSADAANLN